MSEKWEKHYPDDRLYRDVLCKEFKLDNTHSVLIMKRDGCFDSYVMQKDPEEPLGTPFMYMFGTPVGSMPYYKVVEMTIRNAPDYYHLCEEGY